jgi:glycosyltransferase involved in cell wall biosynthesis
VAAGYPAVSAVLIVRDEAAMLAGCLDSIRGRVDEIIVVDTGSIDASPDIALSFGAKLLREAWEGDFARARNYGLDAATGDWILYIDADERLTVPPGTTLGKAVAPPGHGGFKVKFRPKLGYSPYQELRLFLADPRVRFESRIHERVVPSLLRLCEAEGLTIGTADVAIEHLGYEGDQSHKHVRNLPLLARAVEDDPDRVYLRWHLGETLSAIGDKIEAEPVLRGAITTAQRTQTRNARIEAALAAHALARIHLDARDPLMALAAIGEGLEMRPDDPALLLLKGRALIDQGDLTAAIALLSRLPLDDPDSFLDPDMAYDLRIFGEWAYDLIGLAAFRAGRHAEAAAAYEAAAERAAHPEQYRARAAVAKARAKLSA